jgi:hypothetical protein
MATITSRGFFMFIGATLCCAAASGQQDPLPTTPLPATTVQLPTFGISIDADGTLDARTFTEFDGKLLAERLAAAKAAKTGDLWAAAKLRKVSLTRLERALAADIAVGREPDDALRNLAGLTRLQFVFCFPSKDGQPGDIIIAGPAEPFANDAAGRAVGLKSGRPTLQLEDLAVALRAYPPGSRDRPFLGCTIEPPADGLAKVVEFQKTIPRQVAENQRAAAAASIKAGMTESLGLSSIRVFGISSRTHFAHVLIEADYRMKRTAMGVEPPPVKMTTFVEAIQAPPHGVLQRWWFTPDYKCLKLAADGLAAEFIGQGVQLQTEDKLIGPDGSLAAAGVRPSKPAELFSLAFTRKYQEIAAASPVYAQLRSLIDLSVAAALIRRYDYYGQTGWKAELFRDETSLSVERLAHPKTVPCVVNSLWKGNRLLVPAGGVSIRPDEALSDENLFTAYDSSLRATYERLVLPADQNRWWWD